jgi:hypothetical protein
MKLLTCALSISAAFAGDCENLASLKLKDTAMTASTVAAGVFQSPEGRGNFGQHR